MEKPRIPRRDSSYSPFLNALRVYQDKERHRGRSLAPAGALAHAHERFVAAV
jgi:hypothetical protein